MMAHVEIELISPEGVPCTLTVGPDDDRDLIIELLDRADKIGGYFAARGWGFAAQPATGPSASELDSNPTFCGYPCSPTLDDRGLPSWILANGQQAMRHEKQGDAWYSIKHGDGTFSQVLAIRKGEQVPAVRGL